MLFRLLDHFQSILLVNTPVERLNKVKKAMIKKGYEVCVYIYTDTTL